LLHAQGGQDHRGKLAPALQHRAPAWGARLQAASARGLHPGIRAGGPATPTSDAARAGATTIIALTIKLDPPVGADQRLPFLTVSPITAKSSRLEMSLGASSAALKAKAEKQLSRTRSGCATPTSYA